MNGCLVFNVGSDGGKTLSARMMCWIKIEGFFSSLRLDWYMTFEGFNQSNHDAMACDHQRFAILHHRHNDEERNGCALAESACLCVFYAVAVPTIRAFYSTTKQQDLVLYTVV
jgi:hypothetical protein